MLAARHPHAALTVQPLPAWVTPDGEKHRLRAQGSGLRVVGVRKRRQDQSFWRTGGHVTVPKQKQAHPREVWAVQVTYMESDHLTGALKS